MQGCLEVSFRRVSEPLVASIERRGEPLACSFENVGCTCAFSFEKCDTRFSASWNKTGAMTASFGLVCATNQGGAPFGYEILWASDGALLTIDGGYLFVKKQ